MRRRNPKYPFVGVTEVRRGPEAAVERYRRDGNDGLTQEGARSCEAQFQIKCLWRCSHLLSKQALHLTR
jgi:hypothetical protein